MGNRRRESVLAVSDVLNADLQLGNTALAAAAWLRRQGLSETAALFLVLSEAHIGVSHRVAQLCGQGGQTVVLRALESPRADFESALDAAREVVAREEDTLTALDRATRAASSFDRRQGALLAVVHPIQRRLARAASFLERGTAQHRLDEAELERWALRGSGRFRALLSIRPERRSTVARDPAIRTA